MTCCRCASMMIHSVAIRFYAASTDMSEHTHGQAWRCPICGHYEDNRTRLNQKAMKLAGVK